MDRQLATKNKIVSCGQVLWVWLIPDARSAKLQKRRVDFVFFWTNHCPFMSPGKIRTALGHTLSGNSAATIRPPPLQRPQGHLRLFMVLGGATWPNSICGLVNLWKSSSTTCRRCISMWRIWMARFVARLPGSLLLAGALTGGLWKLVRGYSTRVFGKCGGLDTWAQSRGGF